MADYENRRGGIGAFTAGFLGAVVGVVGSAAAMFLSNKDNRKKAQKKLEELKEKGVKAFHDLEKRTSGMAGEVEDKVRGQKEDLEEKTTKKGKK